MADLQKTSPYAHSAPFDGGFLQVSSIHKLHYEQYGKKDGKPVIFLHGGPGGHTSKANTNFFNPSIYRVILFDQRGAGKSLPIAELRENTSQHLVSDIEALRNHIGIPKWHMVFGGSWGSTLALLYAQAHPDAVGSLVLRGIFTVRPSELAWSSGGIGARNIYPDQYETFVNYLPAEERDDPLPAYYKLLTADDVSTRLAAAREWNRWELGISALKVDPKSFAQLDDDDWSLAHARLEAHYLKHGAWLEEDQLLRRENLERIRHIPTSIIQGRYDIVCAPQTAWDLHKGLSDSRLYMIPDAGHSATEPGTQRKLTEVCDEYAQLDLL